MGTTFNWQNSQLLNFFLPIDLIFSGKRQNRPVANLSAIDFPSQPREMRLPKPLSAQLSVFSLPYFVFLGILNVMSVSHTNFQWVSSHNLRKFDKQPWIEYDEGFAVNSSTRQSGAKGEWRVSSWLMISIMWKVIYFWSVFWRLFSGVEILV